MKLFNGGGAKVKGKPGEPKRIETGLDINFQRKRTEGERRRGKEVIGTSTKTSRPKGGPLKRKT